MKTNAKTVVLKPKKEQALKARHPWIFSGAIAKIDETMAIGDLVVVKSHEGQALAQGHWCSFEGLVIRILSFEPDKPLDPEFIDFRFKQAKKLREGFGFPNPNTNAFRLINGEGDGLSGLVCDLFNDAAGIECSNPGLYPFIEDLALFLEKNYASRYIFYENENEKKILRGTTQEISFLENNLHFVADLSLGQKTGHFLDQRDNRALVQKYAQGRKVLDCFCYSGGFSVYALLGQALSVTSVDISKKAISLCEKNVGANNLSRFHKAVEADCFTYLRQIEKDEFDLIVLDPPAFAKSKASILRASRGYKDINLLAMKAIKSGGLIFTFSCSQHIDMPLFKKIIFAAAKDALREVKIVHELSQGVDHPVSIYCPQNSYLKGLVLYVE